MNWLPNDKATWGIILAAIAILLGIPLNLVANLLTPKVRNWWAERSAVALKKRIAELESDLAEAKKYPFISSGEDFILDMIKGVVIFTGGIYTSFWAIAMYTVTGFPSRIKAVVSAFGFLGLLFILGFGYFIPRLIDRFLKRTSLGERIVMQKDIEKLSGKLKALEKS